MLTIEIIFMVQSQLFESHIEVTSLCALDRPPDWFVYIVRHTCALDT